MGSSQPAVRREGERGRREEGSEEDSGEEDDVDIIEKDVVQVAMSVSCTSSSPFSLSLTLRAIL